MEIINARIESTSLGYEDHGILTFYLHLKFDGSGQGFGGYALDEYSNAMGKRIPTAACGIWIQKILTVVGVDNWEQLKGKYIRVKKDGFNTPIIAIGNLIEDKWFDPKKEQIY